MYIRDLVNRGVFRVVHKPTEDMLADVFTKGLGKFKFRGFLPQLGVIRGSVQ